VDFPRVRLLPLKKNGGDFSILYPYNEGALVDDIDLREKGPFPHREAVYPSLGAYSMFPNMLCSQFLCCLADGEGIYFGSEDSARGVKAIDFYPEEKGIALQNQTFCGIQPGEDYLLPYPVVWQGFEGGWQAGASLYRDWFEKNLPAGTQKSRVNPLLPGWYEKAPLIVTYPVRGIHDMDKMDPNALFPYTKALPLLDEIAEKTGCQLLVILMHWEGSAPWAPPYVWPPYGGVEEFQAFADALHARGHLLGVYCSGFGYTIQSNLIDEYNCQKAYEEAHLEEAMCAGPDGKVQLSRICTGQRSGYDLCVASPKAQKILDDAYRPLLESDVDYVQILDQNHGGGQYFCYSKHHGHAPGPGPWMTSTMQSLLKGWQEIGGKTLFGCESAASEAFIPHLLFSDNRYELNWHLGEPLPLYAFLYHEYLYNFMGNQVSCGLSTKEDSMPLRMAYSFTAGDAMALVMTPWGELMTNWGNHDFSFLPNKENALELARNLSRFASGEAGPYLAHGRMILPAPVRTSSSMYKRTDGSSLPIDDIFTSAWELDGRKIQIFVNHTDSEKSFTVTDKTYTLPARDAMLLSLEERSC